MLVVLTFFGILDVLLVAYIVFGCFKGRKRGLSGELPRVIAALLLLISGAGLFHWTNTGLSEVNQSTLRLGGPIGFLMMVSLTVYLVIHFKKQVRVYADKRWPDPTVQRRWGIALGGLRAFLIMMIVLVFLAQFPRFIRRPLMGGSAIGRCVVFMLPHFDPNYTGSP
jgi:uncharacterized membrane protein required for colicin V production